MENTENKITPIWYKFKSATKPGSNSYFNIDLDKEISSPEYMKCYSFTDKEVQGILSELETIKAELKKINLIKTGIDSIREALFPASTQNK